MNEDFLHYIWKYRLFDQEGLKTSLDESIKVLKPGEQNKHAGPDFFNARIRLGNTIWAGNVEVHLKASDWKKHDHQRDPAYNSIILHVVGKSDEPVFRKDGKIIPVLSLDGKYDVSLWKKYSSIIASQTSIPCRNQLSEVEPLLLNSWIDRVLTERMENRSEEILRSLKENKNNWEQSFYHFLARNFGFKTNALPFEMLARSLPLSVLSKNKNDLFTIESLLFGQSGMLEAKFGDEYPNQLKKEYSFLRKKFVLEPMDAHLWKFLRMHPANFPTVRIAQFAGLIHRSSHLFSVIMECNKVIEIKKLLYAEASAYWDSHFVFDTISGRRRKTIGTQATENLLINTVVPFLFVYGMKKKEDRIKEKALDFLRQIPSEQNSVISEWKNSGLKVPDAFTSQALLQLKKEYCSLKKCLTCGIGMSILKKK